jgi:hypothetical protein
MPLCWSSVGVWIAPLAARSDDVVAVLEEPGHAALGDDLGARLDRPRDERPGHRLLRAPARGVVLEDPRELDRTPPELRGAAIEHRRRRWRRAREHRHRQLLLDTVRVRVEDRGRELRDAVGPAPVVRELGREAVVEAAVDLGAPTDAPALRVRDAGGAERGRCALVAVLQHHLVERERLDEIGVDPRSLLDDHHRPARARQGRGGDRAAGAGPDDQDLGVERRHVVPSIGAGASSSLLKITSDESSRTYWRIGPIGLRSQASIRSANVRREPRR